MPKPITRAGGKPLRTGPTRWFIKGSYVLDIIFDQQCAQDVDVFYNNQGQPPTKAHIKTFLQGKSWWIPSSIDIIPIKPSDFETRDGGGNKRLNVDTLHINDDGNLGIACMNSSSVPITQADAKTKLKTEKLRWLHPCLATSDPGYLEKTLRKMTCYSDLHSVELKAEIDDKLTKMRRKLVTV